MIIDIWNSGFDKFLKFAQKKEDGTFKVIPRAGMEIYDDNNKIADIWARGGTKVEVFLNAVTTGFGSRISGLLKYQKIERAKEIYNRLKEEYKNSLGTF